MPYYESVFIARQDVSSSNVEELAGQFQQIVEDYGGRVTKTEHWGLRNLAYRIKKNRKGHYVMFNLDCPPEAVHELERNMRFNEDIIRYLTMRTETVDDNPSVMMERKERKDSRRGGGRGGRRRTE
jgi:small subunit ribosomal protein S6